MRFWIVSSLISAALLAGCGGERASTMDAAHGDAGNLQHENASVHEGESAREIYEGRGTVLWFEPGRVYLNHEEIPGFMDAMAMGFDIADPELLNSVEPGTTVRFRVVVESDTFHIDRIAPVAD